jgi:hypothetical protein
VQSQFFGLRLLTSKRALALYIEPFSWRRLGGLQQRAGARAAREPSQTGTQCCLLVQKVYIKCWLSVVIPVSPSFKYVLDKITYYILVLGLVPSVENA